jgi:hypothetical protein
MASDDKKQEAQRAMRKAGEPVPMTEMTVEYVDASDGMDAALSGLEERVNSLEKLLASLDETRGEMVSAFNRQTKEIQRFVDSIARRVGRIYKEVEEVRAPVLAAAPQTAEYGLPERFASDKDHQEAWRTGRILTAELEAYYPDETREGALSGNLQELLTNEIEEARRVYEQSVPERVLQEHDYFSAAIDALMARKKREAAEESV